MSLTSKENSNGGETATNNMISASSAEISTTTAKSNQLEEHIKRPKPQQSRLYSQSSFHAMDFDCYDVNDCYNCSKEVLDVEQSEKKNSAAAIRLPTANIVKSNSSSDIVDMTSNSVRELFKPPSQQQQIIFRSTSSESIIQMKHSQLFRILVDGIQLGL